MLFRFWIQYLCVYVSLRKFKVGKLRSAKSKQAAAIILNPRKILGDDLRLLGGELVRLQDCVVPGAAT